MSELYQGAHVSREEKNFLLDLEELIGKPILNIGIRTQKEKSWMDDIPPRMGLPRNLKHLPEYFQESMKYLYTDRFSQPFRREEMGFKAKEGNIKSLILKGLNVIPNSIGNLTFLKRLKIDCHNLHKIPINIGNLKSLKTLDLMESSNLRSLPDTIGELKSLEKLIITGKMRNLPESIVRLKNFKVLNLFGTSNLTSLPKSLGNLESLESFGIIGNSNCSLDLRNIPIKELPRTIGKLKSLRRLDLSGCKSLEYIPEEIGELENLEILDLGEYDKDLTSIAKGAFSISSWNEVRKLGRKAFTLPENIGNLINLRILNLSFWKNLKYLPDNLGILDALESLNMSFCDSIVELPRSICDLKSIKEINLKACISLKRLPKNIGNLKNTLTRLDLNGCKQLNSIPESIKYLDSLESIDITNCNFDRIPSPIIKLNKFNSLDVSGNPLSIEQNQYSLKIRSKVIDTLPLTPMGIYNDYLNSKISNSNLLDGLLSLIEKSNSSFVKTRCLELIENVKLKDLNLFIKLKELILSDENKYVRIVACKILIKLFPERCKETLNWAIENIDSAMVITNLFYTLDESKSEIFIRLKDKILERYAKIYRVNTEEARFFLDLQNISIKNEKSHDRYLGKDLDIKLGSEGGSGPMWVVKRGSADYHVAYSVSKGHTKGIDLNFWMVNEIPDSIKYLTKLRYIRGSGIEKLPKSFEFLPRLRDFKLSGKGLTYIPKNIISIAKKRYSLKYLHEGVVDSEAYILGIIEMMMGYDLFKLEKQEIAYNIGIGEFYKVDDNGHIIGIYLWSENGGIGVFPNVLCSLKHLKELCIPYADIQIIPECIGNITALEFLDLSGNRIKNIPNSIYKLKKLKHFILDENPIIDTSKEYREFKESCPTR